MTAPGWWYITPRHDLVCAPPKCGLISLKVSLMPGMAWRLEKNPDLKVDRYTEPYLRTHGIGYYTDEEVMRLFPRRPKYLSIRDPVSRFRSLWHDKCVLGTDPDLAGLKPSELMDRIEAYPHGDHHWMPQWAFILPGTKFVRYDELHRTLGLPEVHVHRSIHNTPLHLMPCERIRDHYLNDVELWRQHGIRDDDA